MYPEVHTLAGANIHWRSVEAQGSPNAMEAHCNLLEPSHQDGRPDHYGTLGRSPNPSKAWGNLHNSIGGSQEIATEAPQTL
jgi:hypothetical protein